MNSLRRLRVIPPKFVFVSGIAFFFLFIPICTFFDLSINISGLLGGIIGGMLGAIGLTLALTSRASVIPLFIGVAMGAAIMAFWTWQQLEYGVVTYVGTGGNLHSAIDWRLHPGWAFYTGIWLIVTLPALAYYAYASRPKAP